MWEFAAVVFIVEMYPNTLFFPAFFGLIECLAGLLSGPAVGRRIDNHERQPTMRGSIAVQNGSITLASIVLAMALSSTATTTFKGWAYAFVLAMGMLAVDYGAHDPGA